jgi:hypothetical protein
MLYSDYLGANPLIELYFETQDFFYDHLDRNFNFYVFCYYLFTFYIR